MEKRIGSALIIIRDSPDVERLNAILSNHAGIILGRLGLPMKERKISIISLLLEGSTDEIGSLTGQIGRLPGISIKSVLLKDQSSES
jgi:putative iron-only hydrogenase system regulator